ncbi:MAG: hypothetical protein LH478_08240 [Chitinophagaceae bacterium]|nr:hypothetical protein [Chitinophagaceae bacterium]
MISINRMLLQSKKKKQKRCVHTIGSSGQPNKPVNQIRVAPPGQSDIGFIYSTERLRRWRKNARLKYILETFPTRNMMEQSLLNDIIEMQGMLK